MFRNSSSDNVSSQTLKRSQAPRHSPATTVPCPVLPRIAFKTAIAALRRSSLCAFAMLKSLCAAWPEPISVSQTTLAGMEAFDPILLNDVSTAEDDALWLFSQTA